MEQSVGGRTGVAEPDGHPQVSCDVVVRVLDVLTLASDPETGVRFALDRPLAGETSDGWTLDLSGWIAGVADGVTSVVPEHRGRALRRIAVGQPRPDVAGAFPDLPGSACSGFSSSIGMLGLPERCELTLYAELRDGRRVRLGTLEVGQSTLHSAGDRGAARLQPLVLTSLFRSGTTRMMRLLDQHPTIVAQRIHPYEIRTACYWMHALKVLTEPADFVESCSPDDFRRSTSRLGNNPFNCPPAIDDPNVRRWLRREHVAGAAAFFMDQCEEFYRRVAQEQGVTSPRYFAEKHVPDRHHPDLLWQLYPGCRELFLVRDFRDMVSSILAFDAKRGFRSFGRDAHSDDRDWIHALGIRVDAMLLAWRDRAHAAHLVRYEELVCNPRATVTGVLTYLGLDSGTADVEALLRGADKESEESAGHRTRRDPRETLGRWKHDLAPPLQQACDDAFGEALAAFGLL